MILDHETRQRISTAMHIGDIVYPAKSQSNALNVDIMPSFNQTSPNGFSTKMVMLFGAMADELWGTDVWVEGARKKKLDDLGNISDLTWQRPRLVYQDLTGPNQGIWPAEPMSKPPVNW